MAEARVYNTKACRGASASLSRTRGRARSTAMIVMGPSRMPPASAPPTPNRRVIHFITTIAEGILFFSPLVLEITHSLALRLLALVRPVAVVVFFCVLVLHANIGLQIKRIRYRR